MLISDGQIKVGHEFTKGHTIGILIRQEREIPCIQQALHHTDKHSAQLMSL